MSTVGYLILTLLGLISFTWAGGDGCFELKNDSGQVVIAKVECNGPRSNGWVAFAYYNNTINQTGWAILDIRTNPKVADSQQAYYAGYLEGHLTADLIEAQYHNLLFNYCKSADPYCEKLKQFLQKNLKFVTHKVHKGRHHHPYWHQVGLVLEQMQGMDKAFDLWKSPEKGRNSVRYIENVDLDVDSITNDHSPLWLNLIAELGDIERILGKQNLSKVAPNESCSAFVKLIANNTDLLVAHNTWTIYNFMLRIMKKYSFSFHRTTANNSALVPGNAVAMSSYPGLVFSLDDFYVLSSNLTVLETSIASFNTTSFRQIQPNQIVLEFIRNTVANRLASNGREWTDTFAPYNSGTYNNQFMIIDYNKFEKHKQKSSGKDVLWIIEQTPGLMVAEDVTRVLYGQGYWPSYNRPYFKAIFDRGLWPKKVNKYGKFYSYNDTARGMIFRRDQHKIVDLKSLYKLMRYNDFKNDPLSHCNCTPPYSASLAIAARGDLNDEQGRYNISDLGFSGEGAIDAKMVNSALTKRLGMIAVSGPTNDDLPTFAWSKTTLASSLNHTRQPDVWQFKPVLVSWANKPFKNLSP